MGFLVGPSLRYTHKLHAYDPGSGNSSIKGGTFGTHDPGIILPIFTRHAICPAVQQRQHVQSCSSESPMPTANGADGPPSGAASADAMHVDPALQTATQIGQSLLTQSNVTINQAMDEAMITERLAKGLMDAAQYVSPFEVHDAIVELKKSNKIVDEVTQLVAALRNSETDYRQQVDRFVTGSSGANPNDPIRFLSLKSS